MALPDDQIVDGQGQLVIVLVQAILLGSPEAAQLEMNSFMDEVVLTDPGLDSEELSVDPIGHASRAVVGRPADDEEARSVAVLGVSAGPLSLRFIAASSERYDPVPAIQAAAETSLSNLNYSAIPALGEALMESDFSDWATGEVDSGTIEFDEENRYRFTVNQSEGGFILARSTDHEPFTDVAISVETRMISEDPAAQACLLARLDPEDQLYGYGFCVNGAGDVGAYYEEIDGEGNSSTEPLLPGGEVSVSPPVEWTKLTIIARGGDFWYLVNDEVVGKARHDGPTSGATAVTVNNLTTTPDTPAEFAFNNLVVQAVE